MGVLLRVVVRIVAFLLLAAGIWWTVGSLARGYMVASGSVDPGEAIYPGEIAPTLGQDYLAGAEGLVMLVLGCWIWSKSKRQDQ